MTPEAAASATPGTAAAVSPVVSEAAGLVGWVVTRDHKRIGILILAAGFAMFLFDGVLGLTMRAQLAQPGQRILSPQQYNEFFTMHGTGMIAVSITPFALGLGVYLIPLQVGAPRIAAPRLTLFGFCLYVAGAVTLIWAFLVPDGAAAGWWGYTPLSDSIYSPGPGEGLWVAGVFLAASGMIIHGATVLWTMLRMRAPGMTMLRMPVFAWTMLVTCLMTLASFPALLTAMGVLTATRIDPGLLSSNAWNLAYENLFWFYGHPVVYVMFFPFAGAVAEVLAVFSGRRFFNYTGTAFALLVFAALSMAVWGHHMFISGQQVNDYFSLTSILLTIPAGMEYFGFAGTLFGGRLRYSTAMLFALAFIPQFLIGGLSGIMVATPSIDYAVNNSYFVVAHFHYTLFAAACSGSSPGCTSGGRRPPGSCWTSGPDGFTSRWRPVSPLSHARAGRRPRCDGQQARKGSGRCGRGRWWPSGRCCWACWSPPTPGSETTPWCWRSPAPRPASSCCWPAPCGWTNGCGRIAGSCGTPPASAACFCSPSPRRWRG
jgi:cytochrome c oxidase subunit I